MTAGLAALSGQEGSFVLRASLEPFFLHACFGSCMPQHLHAIVARQVAQLTLEREGTEGLVTEMGSKQAQLMAWLERNEPKVQFSRALSASSTC